MLSEDFCFLVITDEHHGAGGQTAGPGVRNCSSAWDATPGRT